MDYRLGLIMVVVVPTRGNDMKLIIAATALISAGTIYSVPAAATPGRTDAQGCHTDRKGGTGYHCHNGGGSSTSSASTSSRSTRSSSGGAYANCTAARAAGAAPVMRGSPGYGSHLDRDNDGIGCE